MVCLLRNIVAPVHGGRVRLAAILPTAKTMSNSDSDSTQGSTDVRTLCDWFAGQVLSGLISAPRQPGVLALSVDGMATAAYGFADAMMRARAAAAKPR